MCKKILAVDAGDEVGRSGHTPATSSSAADQDIDIVNLSSGNPDHGHSSCAGGVQHPSAMHINTFLIVPCARGCPGSYILQLRLNLRGRSGEDMLLKEVSL